MTPASGGSDEHSPLADDLPAGAGRSARARCLSVLHTPDPALRGRIIPLAEGLSIGRSADAGVDLAINDRLLSRRHASVLLVGATKSCELVDHDSRNGSFVNGSRVARTHIPDGSVIRLGVTLFELTSDLEDNEDTLDDVLDDKEPLLGRSATFRAVLDTVASAAKSAAPVTVVGETGTGKKAIAKRIHAASARAGRFVAVNCGNTPHKLTESQLFGGIDDDMESTSADGFLPMAAAGTLLLSEVDLLAPELQDKLLDYLETGLFVEAGSERKIAVDVRVIAATGANLEAAVEAGAFSRALAEKLAGFTIEMPSLRTRRSDIPLLAQHFLRVEAPARRFDWSATCLEKLLLYDWPNNVRELHHVMRRLTLVDDDVTTLRSAHLPREIRKRSPMATDEALKASAITVHSVPSRQELADLLTKHKGNVAAVAEHYAKDRRHVYRWLLRHDLSAADFRD
jgi:DNA-binding NtrC family response regulator